MKKITFILFALCFSFCAFSQENVSKKWEEEKDPPLRYTEEIAEPVGGMDSLYKFIYDNLVYPAEYIKNGRGIGATVFVEFVIEEDGSISNVKVLSGVNKAFDEEAVRVVKMLPKWKPAKHKGKPVRVFFNIPVRFALQD